MLTGERLKIRKRCRELLPVLNIGTDAFALLTGLAGDAFSPQGRALSGSAYPAFSFQGVRSIVTALDR